jgi:mono/diheme cytochrome c family protein
MVPLNLGANEIDTLVRYFQAIAKTVGQAPPSKEEIAAEAAALKQDPRNLERGRELFAKSHCYQCHQFGNVKFAEDQGSWGWMEGRAEAPNLRYARERLVRRTAFDWIRDPAKMSPGTRMPKFNLSDEDVIALVDYIFEADPGKPPADLNVPEPARKAAKPPTWDVINAAIFQETCIHCHQADNLGGPGNTGAYGFRARRLDLSSYAGIRRGSLQPDGTRLDILKPREGGLAPLILERVGRRVEENKRDKIEPFRDPISDLAQKRESRVKPGMPFGHPALTAEQIALLQAWIEAGAPGPKPKPLGETDEKKKQSME